MPVTVAARLDAALVGGVGAVCLTFVMQATQVHRFGKLVLDTSR